jgi:thiosulfate dehydrogenase
MAPLGKLGHKNPWEVLHKIINGQSGKKMPSLRAFNLEVGVVIMSYIQTLEK